MLSKSNKVVGNIFVLNDNLVSLSRILIYYNKCFSYANFKTGFNVFFKSRYFKYNILITSLIINYITS